MQGFAVVLGLAAAACLYLAARNQVWLAPGTAAHARMQALGSRLLCWLALGLTVASFLLWNAVFGWGIALVATLITVTTGLSLWPFVGTYAAVRRRRAARGKEARA
jgi:hypothetical protein